MQKAFFKVLRFRFALAFGRVELDFGHTYPALTDTASRRTRGGVARTDGLLSAVPLMRDWSDLGSSLSVNRTSI